MSAHGVVGVLAAAMGVYRIHFVSVDRSGDERHGGDGD